MVGDFSGRVFDCVMNGIKLSCCEVASGRSFVFFCAGGDARTTFGLWIGWDV